ncbi:uncharacterized protein LOC132204289 [Neocloeon triangulifer]|uniref:uncharacterized protein LOC132204289 n=1 Tax=Neocloeon triangulifer TaxID=2078957 RepID=UPI00286F197E|nr:uncharacterized protein LOC132204289 [Neocloeon triangulifer]
MRRTTRSTIANFERDEIIMTENKSPNSVEEKPVLDSIFEITANLENSYAEESYVLLTKLRRQLELLKEDSCFSEDSFKGYACHHGLNETLKDEFILNQDSLRNLLVALGSILEGSLKSGIQDSLPVLNILESITCTYYGRKLVSMDSKIMEWIFAKLDNIVGHQQSEFEDHILNILQKCSRSFKAKLTDDWIQKALTKLKDLLLNDHADFIDKVPFVYLDIFLNILINNRTRLSMIPVRDLKAILGKIGTSHGRGDRDGFLLMAARLQLLLTPYEFISIDINLTPTSLSISHIILLLSGTLKVSNVPDETIYCIDCINLLCDVVRCNPNSVKWYQQNWLLLFGKFLALSDENKEKWYNCLAEPLLELISCLQYNSVKLAFNEETRESLNNWTTETCFYILNELSKCDSMQIKVICAMRSNAFSTLAKSITSEEILFKTPNPLRLKVVALTVEELVRALKDNQSRNKDLECSVWTNAAKFITKVADFDGEFSNNLNKQLLDAKLCSVGGRCRDLALASVVLASYMGNVLPTLWLDKAQAYFERDDVCEEIAHAYLTSLTENFKELNLAVSQLTEKGQFCLRNYLEASRTSVGSNFQSPAKKRIKVSENSKTVDTDSLQEVISKYENKLIVLNMEVDTFKKLLASQTTLSELNIQKANTAEQEKADLIRWNLELITVRDDLHVQCQRKEQELKDLQRFLANLKQVAETAKINLEIKTKELAKAEQELSGFKDIMEKNQSEKTELKKTIAAQEQKLVKFRQLAQDNKLEMAKQEEALNKKDHLLKSMKEENTDMLKEIEELRIFRASILNVASTSIRSSNSK